MLQPLMRQPQSDDTDGTGRARLVFDKVIVAIHGIGNQSRCATVRSVARQFGLKDALPLLPLGHFSPDPDTDVKVSRLDGATGSLARTGFTEVYWADIPRKVVLAGDVLDETKAWGRTVVSRAAAVHKAQAIKSDLNLTPADFQQAAGVVDEIVESVQVLENLCWVAQKLGIFRFELAPLLRDYVDDVQVVTEFAAKREEILARFHQVMAYIVGQCVANTGAPPEIHVVAHSEGSVVSFMALLQALAYHRDPNDEWAWIRHMRGFMTIGSPIDKHLALWPALWNDVSAKLQCRKAGDDEIIFESPSAQLGQQWQCERFRLPTSIKWRNYYDHGDPVGFRLDTARQFLVEAKCAAAFEFRDGQDDIGFTRYPLPGAAHVGYWTDKAVFQHFIDDVIRPEDPGDEPKRPRSRPDSFLVSYTVPYALMALLCIVAVFMLYKGFHDIFGIKKLAPDIITRNVLPLAGVLAATTIMARVPRLLRSHWLGWRVVWLVATACLLTAACIVALQYRTLESFPRQRDALFAAAWAVGVAFWLPLRLPPRWGRWLLLGSGSVAVATVIGRQTWRVLHAPAGAQAQNFELWPALLAGGAFVYLWWLAIMVFDLTLVWHRYIRHEAAPKALRRWHANRKHSCCHSPAPAASAVQADTPEKR